MVDNSAMGDLLGEDVALVQKDKLYRCLDRLLLMIALMAPPMIGIMAPLFSAD